MNIKGNAVVLTNGKFESKSAKTAHGLIRGSSRFNIVAVIDSSFSEKYVHVDNNGKIDLLDSVSNIPIFKPRFCKAKARLIATVDLPTPPFALETSNVNLVPLIGVLINCFGGGFLLIILSF